LDSSQWRIIQNNRAEENNEHSNNVDRELELQEFSNVVINVSTVFQSSNNGSEVVIQKDDITCTFCNISSGDTHCETNVGLTKSWSIVGSITSDGYATVVGGTT